MSLVKGPTGAWIALHDSEVQSVAGVTIDRNLGTGGANLAGFATCVSSHWWAVATGAAAINTQITGT